MAGFAVTPLSGIQLVEEGDDLAALLLDALAAANMHLADGDIVAVAQKIVSKAEGQLRAPCADVEPSKRMKPIELAARPLRKTRAWWS